MKLINLGIVKLYTRPSCTSTFATVYGIGKVKASRLNAFLLNHPMQKEFERDFVSLLSVSTVRNIFTKLIIDKRIRLFVSQNLRNKMLIFCYQAYRLFQNLPTRGQRTKANAGTPSRLNPYLSLQISPAFYTMLSTAYKRKELYLNGRFKELKTYTDNLEEKEKSRKSDRKLKDKTSMQNYIKAEKLKNV